MSSVNNTLDKIALQIKTLEQNTTLVTLSRNASVIELKQKLQIIFKVECDRQRLIFQGRVLKDDKKLKDYANLDDGKVIHLVVRPADAPHNPSNDDPNAAITNHRGARHLPSISGPFPMMEGYAFITLDSTLTEINENNSLISSLLNGLQSGNRVRTAETPSNNTANSNRSGLSSFLRSPFSLNFSQRGTPGEQRPSISSGFPPSIELRLARTLASMRNVRAMLNESTGNEDNASTLGINSTAEQLQEIRNRLRNYGGSQLTQIGTALDELADLVTETVPRMRQVAQIMRQASNEDDRDINRRVLFASRIVQGMSLINHFMGSVLATMDIDTRRQRLGTLRTTLADTMRNARTDTPQRIESPTDSEVPSTSEPKEKNNSLTASTSNLSKRPKEDEGSDQPLKKTKQEKGKGKDKTD